MQALRTWKPDTAMTVKVTGNEDEAAANSACHGLSSLIVHVDAELQVHCPPLSGLEHLDLSTPFVPPTSRSGCGPATALLPPERP